MKFPQDETYKKLEKAVKDQDRSGIEIQAHTLKGVALNMGFDTLGGACSRLVGYVRENEDGEESEITEMFGQINQEYTKVVDMLALLE